MAGSAGHRAVYGGVLRGLCVFYRGLPVRAELVCQLRDRVPVGDLRWAGPGRAGHWRWDCGGVSWGWRVAVGTVADGADLYV